MKGLHRALMKASILHDHRHRCFYCGRHMHFREATLDHLFPKAWTGMNDRMNLVAACFPCNQAKADCMPTKAQVARASRIVGEDLWARAVNFGAIVG